MMSDNQQGRPIDNLEKALDKRIYIKLKGKRSIKANLRSFDEHLNLFLEDTVETYYHYDREQERHLKYEDVLDSIILRGDNVVFLTLDDDYIKGVEASE
ncbi:MAG: LSM domain-containing protein [Promethearchaeota archaeon]